MRAGRVGQGSIQFQCNHSHAKSPTVAGLPGRSFFDLGCSKSTFIKLSFVFELGNQVNQGCAACPYDECRQTRFFPSLASYALFNFPLAISHSHILNAHRWLSSCSPSLRQTITRLSAKTVAVIHHLAAPSKALIFANRLTWPVIIFSATKLQPALASAA